MLSRKQVFLSILFASFLPDLLAIFLAVFSSSTAVPYNFKQAFQAVYSVIYPLPWKGAVFGLCFSTAVVLMLRGIVRLGVNEIIGMALVCGLVQFSLPILLSFAEPLLKVTPYMPPTDIVLGFCHAFVIAVISSGGLHLSFRAEQFLSTGLIGALIPALRFIPNFPFSPQYLWYSGVGGFIGYFVSRMF